MATKRSGKYRHIFGDPAKPEKQFLEVKNPMTSGEGQYVKANTKFWAVARAGGGGPLYIRKHDDYGRLPANVPMLSVHKGKTWDFDFHPFIENMIATGSEDCRAAVSQFPMDGLTEMVTDASVVLQDHQKKVTHVQFNPSANSILATASFDRTVKVWNIETAACVGTCDAFKDTIYSMKWNKDGSQVATTSKDKVLRIFDPRNMEEVQCTESFDGSKSSKVFWVPQHNWIGACGFSKTAKRQLRLWDVRNLEKPIYQNNVDAAAGVMVPEFDDSTGVLYIVGKGQGTVTYSEIINDDRKVYDLGLYRTPEPQKGGGWLPKRALDVWKCETMRFLKLTSKSVIPVSFIVPRKAGADVFQEDIYPDAPNGAPALTADEWLAGENKDPVLGPLDPAKRTDAESTGAVFTKKKTYAELNAENAELLKRVRELEAKLTGLGEAVEPYGADAGDEKDGN